MLRIHRAIPNYVNFSVNSKFKLIIGVKCALRLGLITFKTSIFQNWSDNIPIDSVDKNVFQIVQGWMEVCSAVPSH